MKYRSQMLIGMISLISVAVALPAGSMLMPPSQASAPAEATAQPAMPRYNGAGALQLPQDWRRWVFVGSSLGLSYAEGGPANTGMEMFHETLMEPTAYEHFAKTGTFREGTMFALVLHGTGEGVLPARRGRFAAEIHGVEMAVKDSKHRSEGWAYYNFGGMNGIRNTAQAMPKESCYNCHIQHAKRDNVFLQFYPMLEDVAPRPVAAHENHTSAGAAPAGHAAAAQQPQTIPPLAIGGLDPVLLVTGQEEKGKSEIVADHKGYRYQFVSEPHRATFASNPQQYAIQNDTCPVVAGAPIDPSLFAVHEGKIYALATPDCVQQFKARPTEYVKP
jgi:YHS domain-containing protein